MDWISIGTLGAAVVAAGAAVWAAIVSHRQLRLAAQASAPEMPVVVATVQPVDDQPDWSLIYLEMRNRAAIPIDLLNVTMQRPRGVGLLSDDAARSKVADQWNDRPLLAPLPADKTERTVASRAQIGRAGNTALHSPGEFAQAFIYAHCPPSRLAAGPEPRLILEMRWRDQTTKTFAMAVNVIRPSSA